MGIKVHPVLRHWHLGALAQYQDPVMRVQDLSDIQWQGFREGFKKLGAAMAAFAAASRVVRPLTPARL